MSGPAEPRLGLRETTPYTSPQLDVAVRLNTNECPYPLPEGFTDDLVEAVRELALNRYPDRSAAQLRNVFAAHTAHPVEGTWVANGSNEVIQQLLMAYGGPERTAAVFPPTYELYGRLSWVTHTAVAEVETPEPWLLGPEQIAAVSALQPSVTFVCSPNNPTGNAQPVEVIAELAGALDGLVIVDEAYVEFSDTSALGLVARYPNVAVVRTMSKAFALAGARLGYLLADPAVVDDLQRVRLPYHVSSLAQAAGLTALAHAADALSILDQLREQRDRILVALSQMPGVTAYPSDANFVLFRPPGDAGTAWQGLLDRGVLIRDFTATIPGCLRVNAGTPEETGAFLTAIEAVLEGA